MLTSSPNWEQRRYLGDAPSATNSSRRGGDPLHAQPGGQACEATIAAHKLHYQERGMWSEGEREQGSRRGGLGGSCLHKSAMRWHLTLWQCHGGWAPRPPGASSRSRAGVWGWRPEPAGRRLGGGPTKTAHRHGVRKGRTAGHGHLVGSLLTQSTNEARAGSSGLHEHQIRKLPVQKCLDIQVSLIVMACATILRNPLTRSGICTNLQKGAENTRLLL
jgi:hypothetical protein